MKSKPNIAVVCFTGDSGLTDYSVSLCKALTECANVAFITAHSYDAEKYAVHLSVVKIFRRTRHYPIDIIDFVRYVLKSQPDIILFQSWLKYPLLERYIVDCFKRSGIIVALTIHDLLPHYPKPWSRRLLSMFYKRFDKLIVHASRTATSLQEMGVNTQPLAVPHGVYDIFNRDHLSQKAAVAHFPEIQPNDFVVLFFGHIETRKGILDYLHATTLLKQHPNIKWLVAGGNSLSGAARKTFEQYRQSDHVILHDASIPMDKVQYYFSAAHVVVLPYLEGTTSGVIKLAIAFNKPIIVTDVGDFSETLADWTGTLISSHQVAQELATAILNMHAHYGTHLTELEKNLTRYQWPNIAKQHMQYLTQS